MPIARFTLDNGRVLHRGVPVSPPRLRVTELIGEGANGAVYRAFDSTLQREVALKLWFPHKLGKQSDRALQESRKNAFVEHQRVVMVFEFDDRSSVPAMTMQLVPGRSAKQWLETNPPVGDRIQVWKQYCEALSAIYAKDTVHGDPHTGNILLHERAGAGGIDVRLTDMGASVLRADRRTFEQRECDILVETCGRLFPSMQARKYLRPEALDRHWIALRALDAAVRAETAFVRLADLVAKDEHDAYDLRGSVLNVAHLALRMPLFDLVALWHRLAAFDVTESIRREFLAVLFSGIDESGEERKESSWRSTDRFELDEVAARHERWAARWLPRQSATAIEFA